MQSKRLSLVQAAQVTQSQLTSATSPALVQISTDRRKLFWRAYLTWQATATADEMEQLELILAEHAQQVRPLMDALSDALSVASRLRETSLQLPSTLLAELLACGWKPAPGRSRAPHKSWPAVA